MTDHLLVGLLKALPSLAILRRDTGAELREINNKAKDLEENIKAHLIDYLGSEKALDAVLKTNRVMYKLK